MKSHKYIALALAITLLPGIASAQSKVTLPVIGKKDVLFSQDTLKISHHPEVRQISAMTNTGFSMGAATANWVLTQKIGSDALRLSITGNQFGTPRQGYVSVLMTDGNERKFLVQQAANPAPTTATPTSLNSLAEKLTITGATATAFQNNEGIDKSYDNNTSTIYHSPWYNRPVTEATPVSLTYTLSGAPHVDYVSYTSRLDGNNNGYFGLVEILYSTTKSPNTFISLGTFNFGMVYGTTRVPLGESGIDDVKNIRLTVKTGANNFASAAEIAFYKQNNTVQEYLSTIFTDNLCTKLRPGITTAELDAITIPEIKTLAKAIAAGDYSQEYRVGEFQAYETLETLSYRLKTNRYNYYENPTGIYFQANKSIVIFVEGASTDDPVKLIVKNFGQPTTSGEQSESLFPLTNGINIVTPTHRGNGYINYFTDSYQSAPKVKIHFAMANENGYFDVERGDDNTKWQQLLANAQSDILDMRSKRIQLAYPVARLREHCPTNGVQLMKNSDSTIYLQREILGLLGKEPKNRQFARVVWNGFMYADNYGAAVDNGSVASWIRPATNQFEFWGFAHELGHVNQVRPDFNYGGCGETTNNIFSAWVQFKLSTANFYRLESETNVGINEYKQLKGGRFNTYLEQSVRLGTPWQLVDGSDYHGAIPNTRTVNAEDYEGNVLSQTVTTTSRNYDHFVKLVPLWQLLLYCDQAGASPGVYGKVFELMRTTSMQGVASSGKYQLRFIKMVCDVTGMNFLPFFKKAGMLKPIDAYIEDYGSDWLKINEAMITELETYVAGKNYPLPGAEVNYISALNWRTYANKAALTDAGVNRGTSYDAALSRVTVQHSVWKNVVAFETYDASGKLLRISMQGLGGDSGNTYTQVLFPEKGDEMSSYIMAVGWDGTRIKCYQK